MGEVEEAFKLKARELMDLIAGRTPVPRTLEQIRGLFNQAKALYDEGRVEEAVALLTQAIEKVRKF